MPDVTHTSQGEEQVMHSTVHFFRSCSDFLRTCGHKLANFNSLYVQRGGIHIPLSSETGEHFTFPGKMTIMKYFYIENAMIKEHRTK